MRRFFIWLGIGVLTLVVTAGATLCTTTLACQAEESFWPTETFVPERWIVTQEDQRYVMAKDLIDRELMKGLTRDEILGLLGPASSDQDGYMGYVLKVGSTKASFNQIYVLDIAFDSATKKVARYGIRGD